MLNQKSLLTIIGSLLLIIVVGYFYGNYKINAKEQEIKALNISIINKNLEIHSLLLDKEITKETNDLGDRLTTGIIIDLDKVEDEYTEINDQLVKSIELKGKEGGIGISTSVIDSIWSGYEAIK